MDVQARCTSKIRSTLEELENQGYLSPDNPIHLWCLHFCYLPLINTLLGFFQSMWNGHGLRTEQGRTPEQLRNQSMSPSREIDLIITGLRNAAARSISISLDPLASLPHSDAGNPVDFEHYGIDNLGA